MPRGEILQDFGDAPVVRRAADVGGDEDFQLVTAQGCLGANAREFGCGYERLLLSGHLVALSGRRGYYLGRVFHARATSGRLRGFPRTKAQ